MSTTDTALTDFGRIRDSRRNAALAEYRQTVEAIAAGDAEPADFAASLDNIMLMLSLSDDDLAQDVAIIQEHRQRQAKAESNQDERSELEAQLPDLDAKVVAAHETVRTAEHSLGEAQLERHRLGIQVKKARDNDEAITQIEKAHPRLFD